MSGPSVNQYKDLGASIDGSSINGLTSVSYSYRRTINNIFSPGNRVPITYGSIPEIDLTITGYAAGGIGGFNLEQANKFCTASISGKNGSAAVGYALLTSLSYNFTVDEPFTISKTFTGISKPAGSGSGSSSGKPYVIKRQDYSGGLPAGINGNHLRGVRAEISLNREFISQFGTRKPYASVLNFPITRSITYDVYADKMDSVVVDDLQSACKNPSSTLFSCGISACGVSFDISSAHVTNIEYGGGDASARDFQTISITFTSYEDIPGLKAAIIFNDI